MTRMLLLLGFGVALATAGSVTTAQAPADVPPPPYKDPRLTPDQRADDLLSRMTPAERARMLAGSGWMESSPNERLGIPAIKMADGPLGVRSWAGSSAVTNAATAPPVYATAFPAGIAMASSWDTELVQAEGRAIAQQTKALGRDMILAPTVNIARTPLWGRNFEGYGEDPYLAARMGVAYVRGVQGEGVIPSVKHFAANNQEFERHRIDEKIDLRGLHEIYFPAFRAAVQEAGAWGVMNAYNKLNGRWCAESAFLLGETLRKRWGFSGFVISDWGSTYSTAGTIGAGMDLEMPGGERMRSWLARPDTKQAGNDGGWLGEEKVLAAVAAGEVITATARQLYDTSEFSACFPALGIPPGIVTNLRFEVPGRMRWDAVPGAMIYDVFLGLPPDLINLTSQQTDSCRRWTTPLTTTGDILTEVPKVGTFFWFLVTASRIRACACDTATRLCVRTVLCSSAFSLALPLRSTGSAAAEAALFARFSATTGRSDFSLAFIVGYGLRPSRRGPGHDWWGQR